MIEEALYSLLTNNSNVANIVSTRIYPDGDVPDKPTRPFLTQKRVATAHTNRTHSGKSYQTRSIEIDCYASTPFAAKGLAETINTAIDSYKGTVGSYRIDALFVTDIRDYYESETGDFICTVEILIWAIGN